MQWYELTPEPRSTIKYRILVVAGRVVTNSPDNGELWNHFRLRFENQGWIIRELDENEP